METKNNKPCLYTMVKYGAGGKHDDEHILVDADGYYPSVDQAIQLIQAAVNVVALGDYEIQFENIGYRRELYRDQVESHYASSNRQDNAKRGYVYLFHAVHSNRYKIGYSRNPKPRGEQIGQQTPEPIKVIYTIKTDDMERLEAELHSLFADKQVYGEWFNLSPVEVDYIMNIVDTAIYYDEETSD